MFPECPVRNVLTRVGDKWSVLVMLALDDGHRPLRFNQIQKAVPDISQKMLTRTLRDLEADGFVARTAYAEVPPRVEYEQTERCHSLMPLIKELIGWALDNLSGIVNDRQAFIEKKKR